MALSVTDAQAQLDAWLAASLALAKGKTYAMGDRQLTRANAEEVQGMINYWESRVAAINSEGRSVRPAVAKWS